MTQTTSDDINYGEAMRQAVKTRDINTLVTLVRKLRFKFNLGGEDLFNFAYALTDIKRKDWDDLMEKVGPILEQQAKDAK